MLRRIARRLREKLVRAARRPSFALACSLVWAVALPAVALASGDGQSADHATADGGHHGPGLDLLWHGINVAILLFLVVKFAKKPMADSLAQRREHLQAAASQARAAQEAAEAKLAEANAKVASLTAEIERLTNTIRHEAEMERQNGLTAAAETAARLQRDAQMAVDAQVAKARKELTEEATRLALALAEKSVSEQINDSDRARLLDACVRQIEERRAS